MSSHPEAQPEGGFERPARGVSLHSGSIPPEQTGQARPANPLPGAKEIGIPSLGVEKVPTSCTAPTFESFVKMVMSGRLDLLGGHDALRSTRRLKNDIGPR